jgi:hypothetical protein
MVVDLITTNPAAAGTALAVGAIGLGVRMYQSGGTVEADIDGDGEPELSASSCGAEDSNQKKVSEIDSGGVSVASDYESETEDDISEDETTVEDVNVRILDVFLANREIPVTRSALEEQSGMSQPTVSRTVNEFLDIGIIEESEDDSPKMFRLNMEHPSAGGLISAYDALYAHVSEIQAASGEFDPDMDHSNEGSPFVELFRYPTNGEILSVLLGNPDAELKAADIARGTDVDDSTVGDNIPILVRIGVVEMIERGRHDRYQLNRDHPAVDGFLNAVGHIRDDIGGVDMDESDAGNSEE